MVGELSLLEYCLKCKAKCCKASDKIGSPILCETEAKEAKKINACAVKEIISKNGKKYYIILGKDKDSKCFFLNEKNKCDLQANKPLDCLCYPMKAVYKKDKIEFIFDSDCPASIYLNEKFIKDAKKIAIKSISRFDKNTYDEWLEKNVGWVKKVTKII